MQKIEPYRNTLEARQALDNGGRFYNLFTKAGDGMISAAEVGKVGGIFYEKQQLVLFLELALSGMDAQSKARLLGQLETGLRSTYQKYRPQHLLPSEAGVRGEIGASAIITGMPRHVDARSDLNGFVMIPIMAGTVMTFMMIPIIDHYDVYELRDEAYSETFLIAHAKGEAKLPEKKLRVGGVIKELKADKEEREASRTFLEAVYYTEAV